MCVDRDIENLRNELEHEKTYRSTASWLNDELERNIAKIQDELRKENYDSEWDDDIRKESERNKQLIEGNILLKDQIPILKEKIKNSKICGADCKLKHDDLNINLEYLSQSELLRTVKRFERMKTDLNSTIRSKEWRLDSESKLFLRLCDQRTYLQNELLMFQHNIMRLQKDCSHNRWSNGVIKKENRVLELKRGPIKQVLDNEKLPAIVA